MNYKGIITDKAAEDFRKEGADHLFITICTGMRRMRDVEIELEEVEKVFMVAGRTEAAKKSMALNFRGGLINGEVWYPFDAVFKHSNAGNINLILDEIAKMTDLTVEELKWALMDVAVIAFD